MFQKHVQHVNQRPVVGLMYESVEVLAIVAAFAASMVIIVKIYLDLPKTVSTSFVDRAKAIIDYTP